MIRSIRHKGLKRLYESDDTRGLTQDHVPRIKIILARLSASSVPGDMDLPGLRLHTLKGQLKGLWAVDVSGNWRIVFRFENNEACDVDLIDYH